MSDRKEIHQNNRDAVTSLTSVYFQSPTPENFELLQTALTLWKNSTPSATRSKQPKFPHVTVQLSGEDGNASFIIGRVIGALKSAHVYLEDQRIYRDEAMSGDYDHVIQTTMRTVTVL